MPVFQLQKDH